VGHQLIIDGLFISHIKFVTLRLRGIVDRKVREKVNTDITEKFENRLM